MTERILEILPRSIVCESGACKMSIERQFHFVICILSDVFDLDIGL